MYPSAQRIRALVARVTVLAVVAALMPAALAAQQPPPQQAAQDSLRSELRRLSALVDSLRAEVARLQAEGKQPEAEDALARLRAAAEAAAAAAGPPLEPPPAQEFSGRERALQALNPELSLNADMFAHVASDEPGAENFFAREFEVSLVSNLDPFSRAKVFIARHSAGGEIVPFEAADGEAAGHDEGFEVEEGYVEWVGLPAGLGLKLGRFHQQFGQLNRWHPHAFPFQSRPLPHLAFFGEEGLGQTGASVRWLAPFGGGAGTYEGTLEVTRSENGVLFGEATRPSVLGHLNAFWQLSRASDLDLGLSWVTGRWEGAGRTMDRNVYGAEASYTWRPPERSKYRGINVRAGVLVLDGLVESDAPRAWGTWSWAEARLSQSWLAGARWEWTEDPAAPDRSAWLVSPTLTWWESEFVRVRAEYDLLGRSYDARHGQFLLQVTFAMGPHKHETY